MAYQAVRTDPHGGHRIQRTVGAGVAAVRAEVYEAGSSAQEGTSMSWRKARGEEETVEARSVLHLFAGGRERHE